MADIEWDTKEFDKNIKILEKDTEEATKKAVLDVANEVLRLSQLEVPHNIGTLQNSGHVEPPIPSIEITVGYNTPYAARLHEHPEYRYQKGRKGKYLEDPIKNNLNVFQDYYKKQLGGVFR